MIGSYLSIYSSAAYMRQGPSQVNVQCHGAQNKRSDLSSSSRWKVRKTSSRRKLHTVQCRCTRMSRTAVLTASSLGAPCMGSQVCNDFHGERSIFAASQAASADAPMLSKRCRSASGANAPRSLDSGAHPGTLYAYKVIPSSLYTAYTTHQEMGIVFLPILYTPCTSGPPLEILKIGLVVEDKCDLHRWNVHLRCIHLEPVDLACRAPIRSNSDKREEDAQQVRERIENVRNLRGIS